MDDIEGVRTGEGKGVSDGAADSAAGGTSGASSTSGTSATSTAPVSPGRETVVCPFLVSIATDGSLGPPHPAVAPQNQCAAGPPPLPQSARQQELVCLQPAHRTCPRYLRGSLRVPDVPPPLARRRGLPRATVFALLILLFSASGALAFAMVRGGLAVSGLATQPPATSPSATIAAVASSTSSILPSSPSTATPALPTPSARPSATASPSPVPTRTPVPTPRPTPAPTAPRSPARTPNPSTGTASRYAVLTPCPDRPSCYIYTVRSGDNLVSIVNWFGVPYDAVLRLNPWLTDPALLRAGNRLVLPPPTR